MVEKIAIAIVGQMGNEKMISQNMKERYVYALIMMTEKWITVGSIIGISFLLKQFLPTLFFLGFFLCLRKRTGGYHANTFWQCYLATIITYIMVTFLSPVMIANIKITYSLVVISVILIAIIGTINHPNMDMDAFELKESKSAARWLIALESMILFASILLEIQKSYISYMSLAIILCAALMCVAKILKQEV
ncbi:accessory gene regulator B family protein [Candidatus Galacturonibacter soehngenii]|uniref:Accessory gene regulator B family protein n=1 Tax=Candidatus Galacturonatibacter soehngenii TaxID=2307010 RepID=A0A7V7QKU8_9FIRM|nr:accessory gene regulator B family protein [Candidatus Galacturonibacter soehngenii]KAB1438475.1 accessory gene regulator B family protein [Candidatus Galacturonibacter soehngenii]